MTDFDVGRWWPHGTCCGPRSSCVPVDCEFDERGKAGEESAVVPGFVEVK